MLVRILSSNLFLYAIFIIVSSEWYKNETLTIIEAYANGKPVITSRVGGLPEIVIEGKSGFRFEMSNSFALSVIIIEANQLSDNEYSVLSKNAHKYAEENYA